MDQQTGQAVGDVPPGTSLTKIAPGKYTLFFVEPAPNRSYDYIIQWSWISGVGSGSGTGVPGPYPLGVGSGSRIEGSFKDRFGIPASAPRPMWTVPR